MHRSPTPLHGQASQTRLQIPSSNTISLKEWEAGNLTGMATLLAAHGVHIDSVMFSLTILYYLKKKHLQNPKYFYWPLSVNMTPVVGRITQLLVKIQPVKMWI